MRILLKLENTYTRNTNDFKTIVSASLTAANWRQTDEGGTYNYDKIIK